MQNYDSIIIGAGPVGLLLAIGLAQQGKSIAIVEKQAPQQSPAFDGRVLALTHGSMLILKKLDLWQKLQPNTTPLKHVHISQKGYLGITQIHAYDMGVDALGYSITGADLGNVLWQEAQQNKLITIHSQTTLKTFKVKKNSVIVQTEQNNQQESLSCQLIVGADGTESKVRKILGIDISKKSYDSFGVIAKIATQQPANGWSYERFTADGPVALLPMEENFHKAVMIVPAQDIATVKNYTDKEFIKVFTEKMGERLGEFTAVSNRVYYPLTEVYAEKMIGKRALLIGNSSHTQHPVAAQGLNLGISDIDAFLGLVKNKQDLGKSKSLNKYQKNRQPEHIKIMGFTDSLITIFAAKSPMIGHLRGLGLIAMESMPATKKKLAKMAMGL